MQVRILALPACRVVTSGYAVGEEPFAPGGTLEKFMGWWGEYDKTRTDRWFPRDFIMYGREENALIWYYAVPDDAVIESDYEAVDFAGGLYAAAVAIDSDYEDEQRVYGAIKKWVADSDAFELDERCGHYDLCHVITPPEAAAAMGYSQLEIYVPIKLVKKPAQA